jgi:hypothetical protein
VNGTTSQPAAHQKVELLTLGEGMKTASEAESGPDGSFTFPTVENTQTPHLLLRVIYQGVNYNLSVVSPEEMKPVILTIYETTNNSNDIKVALPAMLAQASGNALLVQQQYLVVNQTNPKKTLVNPQGTFLFDTPPPEITTELSVAVVGLAGIPLPQTPTPRKEGGYEIAYPIKPGVNEVRISYRVNYTSSRREFKHRLFYGANSPRILVLPADLQVSGERIEPAGQDSRTQAAAYRVSQVAKGEFLNLKIVGEAPEVSSSDDSSSEGAGTEPQMRVVRLPNPVFERKEIILGALGAFFVLAIIYALRQRGHRITDTGASQKRQS